MDLFDFFFPEQAQAAHLRKIAQQRAVRPPDSREPAATSELNALKEDVRFLTLVVAALLRRFSETETASLADVKDLLDEIDALDGVADGGLDPGVLRGLLGVLKGSGENQTQAEGNPFTIVTTPRYRRS